jgi:chemotaxis protein CheD
MANSLSLGLGELAITRDPQDVLVAYGLGSCLGIAMYDPLARVGGMVHAVLPVYMSGNGNSSTPGKFVDTGIAALIDGMVKSGANQRRLIVWMAGGASMLLSPSITKNFDIGNRNINIALKQFSALGIRLSGQEVGGNSGRTVRLYISEGRMTVRLVGQQEHDIILAKK